jgi:hypothetical protein
MSNFPSVRPSLNLQFDSQPTPEDMTSHLASVGATFSRASIGTYTDANGIIQEATSGQARPNYSTAGVHEGLLIEEARTNLIKSSEDFSTTDWGAFSGYVIVNQAIAPDGLGGADKIIWTSDNDRHLYFHSNSFTNATEYTATYFVKADELDLIQIYTAGVGMNYSSYANFDLTNGTVTNGGMTTATINDYGDGWYRISASKTANATSTGVLGLSGIESTSDGYRPTFAGDGTSGLYVWGAQLEAGSFPTSYIPTIPTFTSRASDGTYFDSSGVLQTASTDEERIDHKYIDGEWVEAGLLLEGASTNLFTDSRPHNWSKNAGCTSSTTTSPISTNTYSVLTHDGTNSDPYFVRNASTGSALENRTFTFSAYMYSISGSANIQMFMYDNSIGNVFSKSITLTTTPQLYSLTATFPAGETDTNINCRFDLSNTAQSIGVFEAQAEEGSVATSRIPTTSAQVTRSADVYTTATKERSADVCYIDGTAFTDFYNQEQGTFFLIERHENEGSTTRILNGDVANDSYFYHTLSSASQVRTYDGSTVNIIGNRSAGELANIAIKYDGTNSSGAVNGTVDSSPASFSLSAQTELNIGSLVAQMFMKKLIYFPRALSDNELIKLTQ